MFVKADKRQGRLRIALTAPSGGGKTFSGLLIATGIIEEMKKLGLDTGKGIAVIDTENGSALDYADRFEFDHEKIEPPYTIQKYLTAMQSAYTGGYAVLFVDSLSHAWAGDGGLLQKKEAMDARGGNQYTNWAPITKEHEQLKSLILSNKIHLIAAMRSKQDYIIEQNSNGKSAPRKVGLAPVQREGMEYEFTVVFDLGMDHSAHVSKDRTAMFDGQIFKPTKETGAQLLDWRMSGKPETEEPPTPAAAPAAPSTNGKLIHEPAVAMGTSGKISFIPHEIKAFKGKDAANLGKIRFLIFTPDGVPLETDSQIYAEAAKDAIKMKLSVAVTYEKGPNGFNVKAMEAGSDAAAPEATEEEVAV